MSEKEGYGTPGAAWDREAKKPKKEMPERGMTTQPTKWGADEVVEARINSKHSVQSPRDGPAIRRQKRMEFLMLRRLRTGFGYSAPGHAKR
jgi:hypothetical protein